MDACEHLEQRRLARAVLAEQGVHLAGEQLERGVAEGLDTSERLRRTTHADERLCVDHPVTHLS
ncbi:hypothetical protein [Kineosporia sp. A_224]|uniref:hypothetical protein n=1 Tax=Kineosporia sp. A_224 TaxID=1962180 RepID=UPI0018E95963|nr:hypothetical protein [Kineosporia sp. A_224]